MEFRRIPLSSLLQDRRIFAIFDDEFQKSSWLNIAALLGSDCNIDDLYRDKTLPRQTLDAIVERLEAFHTKTDAPVSEA